MLICMRTTLNLPDALLREAKDRARNEGRTLTSLMEEALRARLDQPGSPEVDVALPSWRSGGMLVDVADREALWQALDDRA